MKRLFAIFFAIAMVAAACGDDSTSTSADTSDDTADDTAADSSGDKATITLIINPWTASRLNAEVAAQLIENELGNPTELINIDEEPMFPGMADGTLDVDGPLIKVFVPSTPNPTTGYYLLLPERDTRETDLTVEQAFKLIISAGIATGDESVDGAGTLDVPARAAPAEEGGPGL